MPDRHDVRRPGASRNTFQTKEIAMRMLTESEVNLVSGGVCENMPYAECITGVVDAVAGEIEAAAGYLSTWWDNWCDYNDLGIWLYNTTHPACS